MSIENSIMWAEIHQEPEVVKNAYFKNKEMLEKISSVVNQRKITKVVLVGRGSSEHALQVAKYLFEIKCGFTVSICAPSVVTLYEGKMDLSDVLTVGVSQCGEAQDVFEVLKLCKESGGVCVSITNQRNSLMATLNEYYMNCECGSEKSITAAKSYLSQLTIVTALVYTICGAKSFSDRINRLSDIVEKTIALRTQIEEVLPVFRNVDDIMIFGRGLSYAMALESELKIQETCYMSARAYASSDYRHGPIATTKRFVPAIFFMVDQKTNQDSVDLFNRLKEEYKVNSLIVTNNEELAKLGDMSILLPKEAEGLEGIFSLTIFSQMFACLLSIKRGYNPDSPIGVSKTTVTI